jgi:hypothetical protein
MSDDLPAERQEHPLPALFARLGLQKVTPRDKFDIKYANDLFTVVVTREDGALEVHRMHRTGRGFHSVHQFNPNELTRDQRDGLVRQLSAERMTQSEIAKHTGISQATVSNVLRKKG